MLLMSGERKALVIYLILTALLFARGRLALIVPALAAAFVGLLLLSTLIENPYLQKQIRTLVEPGGTGNYEYVLATGRYLPGDTPSDVQRAFALHVSSQMFAEHPLIGVGTNQYEAIVGETYPNAPEELRAGDPRRVPADPDRERTGRFLPLRPDLGRCVDAASRVATRALQHGRLTSAQARLLPLLLFIPLALFVGTEASGTRAFIGVIAISLLPELVSGALARARQPLPLRSAPVSPHAGASLRRGSLVSVSVVMTCHDEEAHDRTGRAECGSSDDLRRVSRRSSSSMTARAMGPEPSWSGWTTRSTSSGSSRRRGSAYPRRAICAVREARGEFIAILDGDDFWMPEKLERQLPAFGRSGNIGLVYGDFVDFSRDDAADGRVVTVRRFDPEKPHHLTRLLRARRADHALHAVIRRSVFDDVGLFDESLLIGEDTEFCLRVAEKWRFCHVPGAFTFKRRHPGQISSEARRVATQCCSRNAGFRLTPSRTQVACGTPNGAAPRKGQRRLCDEEANGARRCVTTCRAIRLAPLYWRAWANVLLLLAPSLRRASLLRGAQEAVACLPAVVAFRLIILVRARMRILYVVNGFDRGGAEHGLLTLVENGAFEQHELRVLALCRGRGDLADLMADRSESGSNLSRTATR